MSRPIKFRTWDSHQKRFRDLAIAWNQYTNQNYGIDGEEGHYPVNKGYTIQQFTGIKDKNGREIYEGDIIIFHKLHAPCREYPNGFSAFITKEIKWNEEGYWEGIVNFNMGYDSNNREVIGNIFENPELLEVKNG